MTHTFLTAAYFGLSSSNSWPSVARLKELCTGVHDHVNVRIEVGHWTTGSLRNVYEMPVSRISLALVHPYVSGEKR